LTYGDQNQQQSGVDYDDEDLSAYGAASLPLSREISTEARQGSPDMLLRDLEEEGDDLGEADEVESGRMSRSTVDEAESGRISRSTVDSLSETPSETNSDPRVLDYQIRQLVS
jgi:hypothetical protein